MLANFAHMIAALFPPGLDQIVLILFKCWFVFSCAGILYTIIHIVRDVKGLFTFGK